MNEAWAWLLGVALASIRPAVALAVIPLPALGAALRVPLVLALALLGARPGWPPLGMITALTEAGTGLLLGLLASRVIVLASATGEVIDHACGYAFAQAYDAMLQEQAGPFQGLLTQLALCTLFTGAGLDALAGALVSAPPSGGPMPSPAALTQVAAQAMADLALLALHAAAPVLMAVLAMEWIVGLASRAWPQLDAAFLAMACKALVAAIAMRLALVHLPAEFAGAAA